MGRYAQAVISFIILQAQELFTEDDMSVAYSIQNELIRYTNDFLVPFATASLMETDGANIPSSSWMLEGQKILLSASEEELANLVVIDFVVPFEDLGDAKPGVNYSAECQALVSTFSQPQYDTSVADANTLYSASVIKAKFKLEDVVREALCLPEAPRKQCKDVNAAAFDLALSLATEEARQRFLDIGTRLVFDDDSVSPWGPGGSSVLVSTIQKLMKLTHVSTQLLSYLSRTSSFSLLQECTTVICCRPLEHLNGSTLQACRARQFSGMIFSFSHSIFYIMKVFTKIARLCHTGM